MGPVSAAKLLEYMSAGLLLPTSTVIRRQKDSSSDAPESLTIETALLRKDDGTEDATGDRSWRRAENPPVGDRRMLPSSSSAPTIPSSERRTLPPPGSSPKSGPRAEASNARSHPDEALELGHIPSLTGQDADSGIDRRPLYLRAQNTSMSPEAFLQVPPTTTAHNVHHLPLLRSLQPTDASSAPAPVSAPAFYSSTENAFFSSDRHLHHPIGCDP